MSEYQYGFRINGYEYVSTSPFWDENAARINADIAVEEENETYTLLRRRVQDWTPVTEDDPKEPQFYRLEKSSTVYMDGSGVYYLKLRDRPGILFSLRLWLDDAKKLHTLFDEQGK